MAAPPAKAIGVDTSIRSVGRRKAESGGPLSGQSASIAINGAGEASG
jgi:hypothetical protein